MDTTTYWCSRENRIEQFEKGITCGALLPCRRETCEDWEPGPVTWCIHLIRVGKQGRR